MRRSGRAVPAALFAAALACYAAPDCASCHPNQAAVYRLTGMGRSFSRPAPANTIEDYKNHNTYYHPASDIWYTMLERGGSYFQRQHQIGFDGKETNILEKRVDYIIGSGNHSRTYLSRRADGALIQLPLAWYAEKGGYWAMNPGYDNPHHQGFGRKIEADCLFCHSSGDTVQRQAQRQAIDCERCHAPNHARLSPQRQTEVCLQCHLETTSFPLPNSIVRYERGSDSYRPGEPIADFKLFFDRAEKKDDRFEIAGAAYQLDQSACVFQTGAKLTCITCHNPHNRTANYTAVCQGCHAPAKAHYAAADCVSCHMPKRRTDDVVHVVMTDHHIQRVKRDPGAGMPEKILTYRGEVGLYYPKALPKPEDELYLATAQVIEGSNLTAGITRLAAAIERYRPQRGEHYLQLADALRSAGRCREALPVYEEARKRGVVVRQKMALCLEPAKAIALLGPDGDAVQRGVLYSQLGKPKEATAAFERAVQQDPELPEAWNGLGGILIETGEAARAEVALRSALRLRPNYPEARNNLGTLLSNAGRFEEARYNFEAALRYRPDYNFARYNFGIALARVQRFDEAQSQFETILRSDPNSADAHQILGVVLANNGKPRQALEQYREAVRLRPDFPRASLSLGQALAESGDVAGGLPWLRKAQQSADRAVQEEARQVLRKFGY